MSAFRRFRLTVVLSAGFVSALLPASPARAGTITVTTTTDEYNTNDAACSLREAVRAANTDTLFGGCSGGSGADEIAVPAGTYGLALSGAEGSTGDVSIGDLDVDGTLTIVGTGVVVIDANDIDRIFQVSSGDSLTLSGLTITDGTAAQTGGGILAQGGELHLTGVTIDLNTASSTTSAALGGGIWAQSSTVTITSSRITNNVVTQSDPTSEAVGGGILSFDGALTITDSTISGNVAQNYGGGIGSIQGSTTSLTNVTITGNRARNGDGVAHFNDGSVTITNSTISGNGNSVQGGQGGGIYNATGAPMALQNVTISGNAASFLGGDGGNIYNNGSMTASNTLVHEAATSGNCGGTSAITSLGHNLDYAASSFSPCFDSSDPTNVFDDPKLGPLQDNGGPTWTHAIGSDSAALDAGAPVAGVTTDQRGVPRPYGSAPDIGSYERANCGGILVNRVGTESGEILLGTEGDDGVLGLGGNDILRGGAGRDGLCGGGGHDTPYGGAGNDRVFGQRGNDSLFGGGGNDLLHGGLGRDRCRGGPGRDRLRSCEL